MSEPKSELMTPGYWVGHGLMVLTTIVGVYLAAHTGYEAALKFDQVQTDGDNYHLRSSMHAEAVDNLSRMEFLVQHFKDGATYAANPQHARLDLYIWETMKFSSNTLETPAPVLAAVRRYYDGVQGVFTRLENGSIRESFAARELRPLNAAFRDDSLPIIEADLRKLHNKLATAGVELQAPPQAAPTER